MDIGTAMLLSSGIGLGGSLLGGLAQSSGSSLSREAARRQIELGKNQALINSQMLAPFIGAGYSALQKLYGLAPATTTGGTTAQSGNAFSVPYLTSYGDSWKSPTGVAYAGYTAGDMYDPTGGSKEFFDALRGYGTNFRFDTNNPAYQQKLNEQLRVLNSQLAARGLYGSRSGLDVIDDATRRLVADEFERQYARGYTNLQDLYNMATQRGQIGYNALLDAAKMALGSASTAGGLGNQAAGQLQSAYGQMAQHALINAQNQANLYGGLAGIGMGGINNYMLYQLLMGRKQPTAPTSGGYWGWGS